MVIDYQAVRVFIARQLVRSACYLDWDRDRDLAGDVVRLSV